MCKYSSSCNYQALNGKRFVTPCCTAVWFSLVYSEIHVKSHGSFFTNSWIEERLVQHSCLPSPCMTATRSPGLTHLCDLEHLLVGRWSWRSKPMPGWHRCFSWLLCLTRDLVPPAIRFWKGPDICLILETPLFKRNYISKLLLYCCIFVLYRPKKNKPRNFFWAEKKLTLPRCLALEPSSGIVYLYNRWALSISDSPASVAKQKDQERRVILSEQTSTMYTEKKSFKNNRKKILYILID